MTPETSAEPVTEGLCNATLEHPAGTQYCYLARGHVAYHQSAGGIGWLAGKRIIRNGRTVCAVSLVDTRPDWPGYGLIGVHVDGRDGWDGSGAVYLSPDEALAIGSWLVSTAEALMGGTPPEKIEEPRVR
jgi:hypothetical protein